MLDVVHDKEGDRCQYRDGYTYRNSQSRHRGEGDRRFWTSHDFSLLIFSLKSSFDVTPRVRV